MKTKILPLASFIVALFIYSCNKYTLEDVYKQLDSLRKPYNESFAYTLVDADYTTVANLAKNLKTHEDSLAANDISKFKSFSDARPASKYVPDFIANTFKALDSASAISITYKFDNKQTISNVITITDTINYADVSSNSNNKRLIDTVKKYYPEPTEKQFVVVKYTAKTSETPTYSKAYRLYLYQDAAWSHPTSYELLKDDYLSMGSAFSTNQNFSSSNSPEFYLPIFLKQKFPYQAANTSNYVVYEYYSGSVSVVVDKYLYDGTSWTNQEFKTEQFIHNGQKWLFDPTINKTFVKEDYQVVVDWVKNQDSIKAYVDSYGTAEYYFGFGAYYQNIDMRLTKRRSNDPNGYLTNLTDDQAMDLLWKRIPIALNIYLENQYPTIQPIENGVQMYIIVKIATYEPERHKYLYKFKVTDVGKFELQGDKQMVE